MSPFQKDFIAQKHSPLLVLGPAYSGKSAWAQTILDPQRRALVIRVGPQPPPIVQAVQPEARPQSPLWQSISSGIDLTACLVEAMNKEEQILVDCVNQWIGKLIAEEGAKGKSLVGSRVEEFIRLVKSAQTSPSQRVIIVSSEAGASPPPAADQERFFRHCLGLTNQHLAQWAQAVVLVQAGLPLILKAPFEKT